MATGAMAGALRFWPTRRLIHFTLFGESGFSGQETASVVKAGNGTVAGAMI